MCERPFERGSDRRGVRSNLLPKSESDFQASGRVKWPQRTRPRTRPGSLDRPGRGAHRTPTGGPNFAAVGEQESKYGNGGSKLAGGTGLWRGERPDRTRPHERAHRMQSRIEHTGGIVVACDSRAHLKAWSNRPSWKISLHTKKKHGPRKFRQVHRQTRVVCVFVFVCLCLCTNTQTHKHKRTPISVWVGRKNAKSPGQAPE